MYTIDQRLRGLPATREQVLAVHQSINQPHLAVPGKQAGPAQAFIVGLRGSAGLSVYVYLHLPHLQDCAVYVPERRNISAEDYANEEVEALAFVESMGFMMDNLNFRALAAADQDRLLKTLPVFLKDPKLAAPSLLQTASSARSQQRAPAAEAPSSSSHEKLGRLFAAFCVLVTAAALVFGTGCKHMPSEKEQKLSEIHHDLAVEALNKGNMQAAYGELEQALKMDPYNSRAHHLMGLVMHTGFKRAQEAIPHFQRAIELDPQYSEARVNLGNVHLELKEYDKAAEYYRQALNDMRYPTPFIAEGNLGMALYRSGKVPEGIGHIQSAVTMNPKFCLGFRNLGTIYEETGRAEEACKQFGKYREACPDVADAYYREAVCLANVGNAELAHQRFVECEAKAPEGTLKDDCRRLGAQLQ